MRKTYYQQIKTAFLNVPGTLLTRDQVVEMCMPSTRHQRLSLLIAFNRLVEDRSLMGYYLLDCKAYCLTGDLPMVKL